VPVWFQRQAGRSLPEYRALRGDGSIVEAIRRPELAAEITLQPVRRYGVDAAILFSDIVTPIEAIGFGIDVVPGVGPVAEQPFVSRADLDRLRPLDPEADTPFVLETVRILARELSVPLIGFAGAPFTIASYLLEGRPSRHYVRTKTLMAEHSGLWHDLCDRLADIAIASLRSQVVAGASAVQLFDSWAGTLAPTTYREMVRPHTIKVFRGIADLGVSCAHFGVGTGELLVDMAGLGANLVGVDWRVPIDEARRRLGDDIAVQGNLDPVLCLSTPKVAIEAARAVLDSAGGRSGHVFNLGHGVLPETDPEILQAVVDVVHAEGVAGGDG
jgi:uroporphyrinogen decarboxylase